MTRPHVVLMVAWTIVVGAAIYALMLARAIAETLRAVGRLLLCW